MDDNERWLRDRVCSCPQYTYPSDYNFELEFQAMLRPPTCAACGKWADRIQCCVRCHQHYYQFFWHPRMGWESSIALRGWECFDCLETFLREVTRKVACTKTPPPAIVVSPFYVKLERQPVNSAMQSILDDFDAFLESI